MSAFDTYTRQYQTKWRRENLQDQTHGVHNGKRYPFILSRNSWQAGLWEGIQAGSTEPVSNYLQQYKIGHHTGVHNLRSSWVLCANLYFPFRQDKELISGFLRQHISSDISLVTGIELEYAAQIPYDPKTLLGEPAGSRGKNQTSPDVAFIFETADGKEGIVLTENKFVEHSFYSCSGRKLKYGNPDSRRCLDFSKTYSDLKNNCYMLNWQDAHRQNRRYWEYLKVSEHGKNILKRCPAATAGYQLFRQQALAEAFIESGRFAKAISCVAYDKRNVTLSSCLKRTGFISIDEWGRLFDGKARFSTFTHQSWVEWVELNDKAGKWKNWLDYVKSRYGF